MCAVLQATTVAVEIGRGNHRLGGGGRVDMDGPPSMADPLIYDICLRKPRARDLSLSLARSLSGGSFGGRRASARVLASSLSRKVWRSALLTSSRSIFPELSRSSLSNDSRSAAWAVGKRAMSRFVAWCVYPAIRTKSPSLRSGRSRCQASEASPLARQRDLANRVSGVRRADAARCAAGSLHMLFGRPSLRQRSFSTTDYLEHLECSQ